MKRVWDFWTQRSKKLAWIFEKLCIKNSLFPDETATLKTRESFSSSRNTRKKIVSRNATQTLLKNCATVFRTTRFVSEYLQFYFLLLFLLYFYFNFFTYFISSFLRLKVEKTRKFAITSPTISALVGFTTPSYQRKARLCPLVTVYHHATLSSIFTQKS